MNSKLFALSSLLIAFLALSCSNPEQSKTAPPGPRTPVEKAVPALAATKADCQNPQLKKAYESVCTACHGLSQVNEYEGDEPWSAVVDRMVKKHGAKLTPELSAQITSFLDATLPLKKKP